MKSSLLLQGFLATAIFAMHNLSAMHQKEEQGNPTCSIGQALRNALQKPGALQAVVDQEVAHIGLTEDKMNERLEAIKNERKN